MRYFMRFFFLSIEAGTFAWQKKRTQILLSLTLPPRVTEKIGIPSEYKKKGGKVLLLYYFLWAEMKNYTNLGLLAHIFV